MVANAQILVGFAVLITSLATTLLLLRAMSVVGTWIMVGRNRSVQLPGAADAGKVEREFVESWEIERSLDIRPPTFRQWSSDRRVTLAELEEIFHEPNHMWARIGPSNSNTPMTPDERDSFS